MLKGVVLSLVAYLLMTVVGQANPLNSAKPCSSKKLSIAWHPYKPFSYLAYENEQLVGKDIALISSILNNMKCEYEFVQMTWQRTLVEVERGHIDIGMYAYKTKNRKGFHFSKPYRIEAVRIAVLAKNAHKWSVNQLADLNKQNIVVATDKHTWYGKEFEEYLKAAKAEQIFHIHGLKNRLDMLVAERVDAVVGDPITMRLYMKEAHKNVLHIYPYKIYDEPVHFIFTKVSADINDVFLSSFDDELLKLMNKTDH